MTSSKSCDATASELEIFWNWVLLTQQPNTITLQLSCDEDGGSDVNEQNRSRVSGSTGSDAGQEPGARSHCSEAGSGKAEVPKTAPNIAGPRARAERSTLTQESTGGPCSDVRDAASRVANKVASVSVVSVARPMWRGEHGSGECLGAATDPAGARPSPWT